MVTQLLTRSGEGSPQAIQKWISISFPQALFRSMSVPNLDLSALRLISQLHDSLRETLCRNEPQFRVFTLPEELLTAPDN